MRIYLVSSRAALVAISIGTHTPYLERHGRAIARRAWAGAPTIRGLTTACAPQQGSFRKERVVEAFEFLVIRRRR